jgi:murein DD-endopeptidase MepM/ murein hydrolase activator NlpD
MVISKRWILATALGALSVPLAAGSTAAVAPAPSAAVSIEALPGSVVRWSVPGTKRCGMGTRSWAALQETCYYPIDVLQRPGVINVSRRGAGPLAFAKISVIASSYGSEQIALGSIAQAKPTPQDIRRNTRDQAVVAKVWTRREGPARFTLPLGAPATPLPDGKGFGSKWIFDTMPETSEIHSGVDYPLGAGLPIAAVADGTVVLAEDLFFTGNAVFVDHGDGLFSMYFHFSELKVQAGQDVKKGETLGLVGGTGRATGPHLHLGVRWHGARINPQLLLDDPAKIPAIGS